MILVLVGTVALGMSCVSAFAKDWEGRVLGFPILASATELKTLTTVWGLALLSGSLVSIPGRPAPLCKRCWDSWLGLK